MAKKVTKTGKELERRVADAYREMGARKVEHDVELAGNQIDVYVELEAPGRLLHRIAVEVKDWSKPVGINVVNDFVNIVKLLRGERSIDEGVIVSASGFSKQARNAARTYDIRLLEPADLDAMVCEANVLGQIEKEELEVRPEWLGAKESLWLSNLPDTRFFVPRDAEVQQLREALESPATKVIQIRGMPGIGKKYLVSECLSRALDEGDVSADQIKVIDLSTTKTGGLIIRLLLSLMDASLPLDQWETEEELDETFKELLRRMQQPFIIVLTNFEHCLDITGREGYRFPIRDYWLTRLLAEALDKRHRSKIVITTTHEPIFKGNLAYLSRVTSPGKEELRGFDEHATKTFLDSMGVQVSRPALRSIHKTLQGHPLALCWLQDLLKGGLAVSEILNVQESELGRQVDGLLKAVYQTCTDPGQEVLGCLSVYRVPMPAKVVGKMVTFPLGKQDTIEEILRRLESRSVVVRSADRHRYSLHSIVRLFCYEQLSSGISKLYHELAADWHRERASLGTVKLTEDDIRDDLEAHYHLERSDQRRSALKVLRRIIPVLQQISYRYYSNQFLEECARSHLEAIDVLRISFDYNPQVKHDYGVECARYASVALKLREDPIHVLPYLERALRNAPEHLPLYGGYIEALHRLSERGYEKQRIIEGFREIELVLNQRLASASNNSGLLRTRGRVLIHWADETEKDKKVLLEKAEAMFEQSIPEAPTDYFYRTWAQCERRLAGVEVERESKERYLRSAVRILNTGLASKLTSRILIQDKATTLRQLYDLELDREVAFKGYGEAAELLEKLQVDWAYEVERSQERALLYLAQADRSVKLDERHAFLCFAENALRSIRGHPRWSSFLTVLFSDVLSRLAAEEGGVRANALFKESVDILERALDRGSTDHRVIKSYVQRLLTRADVEPGVRRSHRIREAIKVVDSALRSKKDAELLYTKARLLRERAKGEHRVKSVTRRRYGEAERCLRKAIKLGKQDANAVAELGVMYQERAHNEPGQEAFRKYTQLAQDNFGKALDFLNVEPRVFLLAAIFYRQIWEYAQAYTLMNGYFLRDTSEYRKQRACNIYAEVAKYHAIGLKGVTRQKVLDGARKRCEEAYPMHEDDPRFLSSYAWILLELGDQAGATSIFSQAFKGYADFFPDVLTFLEEADEVYEQEGELWAKAIQSGCGDSMTWCALGSYYKDCVQDLNRAEAAYKVSLVLDRNNVITLHNLGLLIMEAGWQERLLEAAGYFEKSYSLSQGRFKFAREQLTELQAMPEYQRQRRHQRNR